MLPQNRRIRYEKDFDALFTKGRKQNGTLFGLRFGPRYRPATPTRFGFVVGTKISKDAVVRNRLKRWLREATRVLLPRVATGLDIVVVVFPEGREATFETVSEELARLLARAGILKP